MKIRPIHDEAAHKVALARIEALWNAEPGTREHEELDVLATLVDAYERTAFPIELPDPIEAIKSHLEQRGLTRKALEPIIGSRARVSEILTGRRALSLAMIRRLHHELGIRLDVLVREPSSKQPAARPLRKARTRTPGRTGTRGRTARAANG